MIKRDELKLEYQQHQFYEYFNSIFNYDILDTSISENIYLLRETTHKLFYSEFENLEALKNFQNHSLHEAHKKRCRNLVCERLCGDIER